MKILALELSSSVGSIASLQDGETAFAAEFANDRKHSGLFFANLQECLHRHGNPDQIVVGLGPGSYAGTRIAIAAAIGLQAASAAQLVGVPSICALPTDDTSYAVIGDARRQSFFFAVVRDRRLVGEPVLLSADELTNRLKVFSDRVFTTEPLARFPQANVCRPSARILAEIAPLSKESTTDIPLEPIYLREPHITQPKTAQFTAA
jgi:tRNA threonylcarbamoyladenosine biosynthesis protein TsaB